MKQKSGWGGWGGRGADGSGGKKKGGSFKKGRRAITLALLLSSRRMFSSFRSLWQILCCV